MHSIWPRRHGCSTWPAARARCCARGHVTWASRARAWTSARSSPSRPGPAPSSSALPTGCFVHGDACGYVAAEPVDLAACVGATWIGNGVAGTAELLARSLRPGGLMLIGEPYWRRTPPNQEVAEARHATGP